MKPFSSNTKKIGQFTVFTYQEKKKYISVCLELDIVKEGTDVEALNASMREAISGYVTTICKKHLSDELLNRHAPKEYWDKYFAFLSSQMKQQSVPAERKYSTSINVLPMRELCAV